MTATQQGLRISSCDSLGSRGPLRSPLRLLQYSHKGTSVYRNSSRDDAAPADPAVKSKHQPNDHTHHPPTPSQTPSAHSALVLNPLTRQPPVQHVQAGSWLVVRHHVPASRKAHEGKVAAGLDGADGSAVVTELERAQRHLVVGLLAGPLERLGPRVVAEPVADEVGVALRAVLEVAECDGGKGCERSSLGGSRLTA